MRKTKWQKDNFCLEIWRKTNFYKGWYRQYQSRRDSSIISKKDDTIVTSRTTPSVRWRSTRGEIFFFKTVFERSSFYSIFIIISIFRTSNWDTFPIFLLFNSFRKKKQKSMDRIGKTNTRCWEMLLDILRSFDVKLLLPFVGIHTTFVLTSCMVDSFSLSSYFYPTRQS